MLQSLFLTVSHVERDGSKDYARRNLSFPNVNESRVFLRCASNHRIEVTPRFGMDHNDPRARKRLVLWPILIDKLNPISIVLLLNLLPRQFLFHDRSLTRLFGKRTHRLTTEESPLQIQLRKRVIAKHLGLSDVPSKHIDTGMARLLLNRSFGSPSNRRGGGKAGPKRVA